MRTLLKTLTSLTLLLSCPLAALADKVTVQPPAGEGICLLGELDLSGVTCLSGESVYANLSTNANPLTLRDTIYTSGLGTHAPSLCIIKANGATHFSALVGIDDEAESANEKANHGIANYIIRKHTGGDKTGAIVLQGTIDRRDKAAVHVEVDTEGWDYITLEAAPGTQPWADHVDWANAYFTFSGERPYAVTASQMYLEADKLVSLPATGTDGAEIIPLSSLQIENATNGWGTIRANKSIDGNALTLNDTIYLSGVGAHATGQIIVKLNGAATRFVSRLGIDDEVKADVSGHEGEYGICDYRVSLRGEDGATVVVSEGTIRCGQNPTPTIDVDCNGWKYLILDFPEGSGGNSCDHVDWANAYFEYHEQNSTPPAIVEAEELSSKLDCATKVYSQPGVRFMQKIRARNPEATLSVSGLPQGLSWNARRSLIEGVVEAEGEYEYTVSVSTPDETATETVSLSVSASLQQPVPFMGWFSWNVFEEDINDEKVRAVADAFESHGLIDAGYRYLCIDDLWHAANRDASTGKPRYSTTKFPKGLNNLADYVHAKGLKFGIYSDAATKTCAGAYGSFGYEETDAQQYADWGFDLLKYDYCFAPSDQPTALTRYKAMGDAIKATGRDMLYYMCEWGAREPWKWGAETGASCWRCTYDTRDGWNGASGGIGVLQSIEGMKDLWPYSGPNRFNDADMMCVGLHGTGKSSNDYVQGTPGMTQTEYQTQFSLWCLWASPLTLSCDVRNLSDADLAIITNSELIAINQDPMGQQAELVSESGNIQIYAKDLENGDVALGILNLGATSKDVSVNFSNIAALDASREYIVRDLWQHEDVGVCAGSYQTKVASHETKVFRLALKEGADGIGAPTTAGNGIKVTASNSELLVSSPSTEGCTKRILVSNAEGRVVASARGKHTNITVPVGQVPHGVYVVSTVCNGLSRNVKIVL